MLVSRFFFKLYLLPQKNGRISILESAISVPTKKGKGGKEVH